MDCYGVEANVEASNEYFCYACLCLVQRPASILRRPIVRDFESKTRISWYMKRATILNLLAKTMHIGLAKTTCVGGPEHGLRAR